MKILVTGGAGFIGSHVVRHLLLDRFEVTVFDSFVTGKRSAVPEGARVIEGDLRDADALKRAVTGAESIVHLAALVSVPLSVEDPALTDAVNIAGTRTLFDAAAQEGIRRIVYASSAAVYGNEPTVPKREESVLAPVSPYASSKLENERTASRSPVSAMGLRFFNVYGPGQPGNHPYASVVPRWAEAVAEGRPVVLFGDGSQTRDFIHVRDVAAAVGMALEADEQGVANIASGTEISLSELIEQIETVIGRKVLIEKHPPRAGDIQRSVASIERAREVLGFKPSVALRDGLTELFS